MGNCGVGFAPVKPDQHDFLIQLMDGVEDIPGSALTEEHLVEELVGIIWRKRRLRLAEGAAHRQGLRDALSPFGHTAEAAVAHVGGGVAKEQLG
jgi:hypothetical protein